MIVVDASVIVDVLLDVGPRGERASSVLGHDPAWVVPEHCPTEVLSVIRRHALAGRVSEVAAARAVAALAALVWERVPVQRLMDRMWSMRHAVSAYDAGYVAIAGERGLTLVTADARLARTAVGHCRVELVA